MGCELETRRLKTALAVLLLPQIRSYDPAKISLRKSERVREELSRILGEKTIGEIFELAERIFRETWKRASEDPEVTFYDVAAEMLG